MTMLTLSQNEGIFARIAEALRVWKHRRATRVELLALTERQLNDIGLCRGDIDAVVHNV